jgi:hypothetical protein
MAMYLRETSFTAIILVLLGFLNPQQQIEAQVPGPGIGFRNDLKAPVIVQGVSVINKVQRRGQAFRVEPGKTVWDSNLPLGIRYYTVYDANTRILLPNQMVQVVGKDQFFSITINVGNPVPVKLVPEAVPMPMPTPAPTPKQ